MFVLYLKNLNNEYIEVTKCKIFKQCIDEMYSYLNKIDFKSYYQRFILHRDNVITVDYGSRYERFEITSDNNENVLNEYENYSRSLNLNIYDNKQKKDLMTRLINLYEQVESMDNSETKLVIQEFINQKERKLGELLNE